MIKTKKRNKTGLQFILFTMMSLITSLVELGSFALFNYVIFVPYENIALSWWLINYSVDNGGLTAFLAFSLSFVVSQTFNFFVQRKVTFKASNNLAISGLLYALMVLILFALQLWIPTIIRVPLANRIGEPWADFVIKNGNMMLSFLIQFPVIKFIIVRVGQKPALEQDA